MASISSSMQSAVLEESAEDVARTGSKLFKNIPGGVLETAFDVGFAVKAYKDKRKEGSSVLGAGAYAAGDLAFGIMTPWYVQVPTYMALGAAQAVPQMMEAAHQMNGVTSQAYLGSFGGNYQLSGQAATMRQAGIDAIQRNGMNLRNVLGSEARMYDR